MDIPALRLASQGISRPRRLTVRELVASFGAMQAQEFPFARWGIGLRLTGVRAMDVDDAFTRGEILRTHVLRPTWHFVAAEDISWLLALTAPRVHVAVRSYMQHQGLALPLMNRALAIFERTLAGGTFLTRAELGAHLRQARIELTAMQLGFVTMYAELERVICSGPRRGTSFTYALLAERAPEGRELAGDEALATLAERFFAIHGPATVKDFVWWSGLRTADARRGIQIAGLRSTEQDGLTYWHLRDRPRRRAGAAGVHLLPIYDEYLVAYRDRIAVPHAPAPMNDPARSVSFRHALVIDGQVAGTWSIEKKSGDQVLKVTPLRRLTRTERQMVVPAAARYETFFGTPLRLSIS